MWRLLRGGAPLPIPNREVKPRRADDTASVWESRSPPNHTTTPTAFAAGVCCFYMFQDALVKEELFLEIHEIELLLGSCGGCV